MLANLPPSARVCTNPDPARRLQQAGPLSFDHHRPFAAGAAAVSPIGGIGAAVGRTLGTTTTGASTTQG